MVVLKRKWKEERETEKESLGIRSSPEKMVDCRRRKKNEKRTPLRSALRLERETETQSVRERARESTDRAFDALFFV